MAAWAYTLITDTISMMDSVCTRQCFNINIKVIPSKTIGLPL